MENLKQAMQEYMSYWKSYVTVDHVLASELTYSLIYDNIIPEKVPDALATVGLTRLPNRFMLIQVDDYYNSSRQMHITQEFYQKTVLVTILRETIADLGLEAFPANLIGLDKIICFISCPEYEGSDAREHLLQIADVFKQQIRQKSAYTISVCISPQCVHLEDYSRVFPRMDLALSRSYFSGKEFSFLLEDVSLSLPDESPPVDLNAFYPELLASFSRSNRKQLEDVLQKMIQALLESQARPQEVKMELIRLIQRIGDYCERCGVPEDLTQRCCNSTISNILSRSFLSETRTCFRDFFEEMTQAMAKYSSEQGQSFQMPVAEYISAHYSQNIHLGDLAAMMNFSEGHFARLFRREFGVSFSQYLMEYRMKQAQNLLRETNLPVEQIACQVGLSSCSYFCTCFKRFCGLPPGTYRSRQRGRTSRCQQERIF